MSYVTSSNVNLKSEITETFVTSNCAVLSVSTFKVCGRKIQRELRAEEKYHVCGKILLAIGYKSFE